MTITATKTTETKRKSSSGRSSSIRNSVTSEVVSIPRVMSPSHALLVQLRAHYPTACLSADLVQVLEDTYIVRAAVQVEGALLVTAMAMGRTVEEAEDQARSRLLDVLGIVPIPVSSVASEPGVTLQPPIAASSAVADLSPVSPVLTSPPPLDLSARPTPQPAKPSPAQEEPVPTLKTPAQRWSPVEPVAPAVAQPTVAAPEECEITFAGGGDEGELEMEFEYTIEEEPLDTGGGSSPLASGSDSNAVPPAPVAVNQPLSQPMDYLAMETTDLSDAIAQIGAEIERIGWTKKQGSEYLQQTYSKRTRQELTQAELLDFLSYLKALPSKAQLPF
jgi:hypothetical protein